MEESQKSSRIETLKRSLEKKKERLDLAYKRHFDDVDAANGQPLNDKRNGRSTLNRWGQLLQGFAKAWFERADYPSQKCDKNNWGVRDFLCRDGYGNMSRFDHNILSPIGSDCAVTTYRLIGGSPFERKSFNGRGCGWGNVDMVTGEIFNEYYCWIVYMDGWGDWCWGGFGNLSNTYGANQMVFASKKEALSFLDK